MNKQCNVSHTKFCSLLGSAYLLQKLQKISWLKYSIETDSERCAGAFIKGEKKLHESQVLKKSTKKRSNCFILNNWISYYKNNMFNFHTFSTIDCLTLQSIFEKYKIKNKSRKKLKIKIQINPNTYCK